MDEAISFAVPTTADAARDYYANPSQETAEALIAPDLLDAARPACANKPAGSSSPSKETATD